MSEGAGLPMGPFAVLDLIGLDTAEQILRTMYAQSGDRLHLPTPALLHLVTAGWLGRKSGRGFYAYGEQNGELEMDEPPVRPVPVVLAGPALGGSRLVRVLESVGAPVRRAEDAGADHRAVVVVELAGSAGHPGLAGGAEVGLHVPACAPWTGGESTLVEVIPLIGAASGQAVPDVVSALRAAGLTPVVCAAMAGYLLDALTAAQVNDAVRMQESGYASGGDIDAAMRLGCAYPIGPLALLARVGADVVLDVQRALHQESGEPGDLPSPRLVALAERAKAVVQEWNRPANGCG